MTRESLARADRKWLNAQCVCVCLHNRSEERTANTTTSILWDVFSVHALGRSCNRNRSSRSRRGRFFRRSDLANQICIGPLGATWRYLRLTCGAHVHTASRRRERRSITCESAPTAFIGGQSH